ncbi:hypothetical protein Ancab_026063 [Ancistrocladus abbreviatus]
MERRQAYFSRAASKFTMSSSSILSLIWDSLFASVSISFFITTSLGCGHGRGRGRGVNLSAHGIILSAHFLHRSFPSRTTLKGKEGFDTQKYKREKHFKKFYSYNCNPNAKCFD